MRLIDADGLKKSIKEDEELKSNGVVYLLTNLMTCYIDEAPTVDADPVRHGHWVEQSDGWGGVYYDCSACGNSWTTIDGTPFENGMNYCSNCGAKMDEVSE